MLVGWLVFAAVAVVVVDLILFYSREWRNMDACANNQNTNTNETPVSQSGMQADGQTDS